MLLIVCLNVSHLLVARILVRKRELSIRAALGGTPGRLRRQLLVEGLVVTAMGLVAALTATGWMRDGLLSMASSGRQPMDVEVGMDWTVLLFTSALALTVGLILGLLPALQATRLNLAQALRTNSQSVIGAGARSVVSRLLLTSQVAFSLVLLVGAGLLAGTLGNLKDVRKGFDEYSVLLVEMIWEPSGLTPEKALSNYGDLLARVRGLPGVRSASMSHAGLLSGRGMFRNDVFVAGEGEARAADVGFVTPAYFETVGMKLLRGRPIQAGDHGNAMPVAVVNQALARAFFGPVEAPGRQLFFDGVTFQIVGVTGNARTRSLRSEPRPTVFLPVAQSPRLLRSLEVRTAGDPRFMAEEVRRVVREAYPSVPIVGVRTMRGQLARSLMQERLLAMLSSAFGAVALFLLCIGVYGVISQWANHRTSELAVRMALGAPPRTVRWLVLRQAMALVLFGILVGLPGAVATSRLLSGFLFGLGPLDPIALGVALLSLLLVATSAAYLPARRASRVDPMVAFR